MTNGQSNGLTKTNGSSMEVRLLRLNYFLSLKRPTYTSDCLDNTSQFPDGAAENKNAAKHPRELVWPYLKLTK